MRAEINFKYIDTHDTQYHYQLSNPKRVVRISQAHELETAIKDAETSEDIVVIVMQYEASQLFNPLLKVKQNESIGKHIDLVKLYYFNPTEVTNLNQSNINCPETIQSSTLDFEFIHDKATIIEQIEAIQQEIRLGNTYQVNFTTRLTAQNKEKDLYHVYEKLSQQHGNYTAYIEDDTQTIVSISPELFFQYDLKLKHVLTKPMKGTMPTSDDAVIDRRNYRILSESIKDKAENVMIVDLLRNDLSKIALKGSVNVPHLFTIERYLSVYQMTSTITANIGENGLYDILKALFPCGSITGAPKQSTMTVIDRLEDTPRSVYCGTIGLIVPNDVAIFNVPIRTLEYQHHMNHIVYGVGGGITIDSNPELEYNEMVAKSNVLKYINDDIQSQNISIKTDLPTDFHLIETMRVENGNIKRKDYHLKRLINALVHFKIPYEIKTLQSVFNQSFDERIWMYRVTVDVKGTFNTTVKPMSETQNEAILKVITKNDQQFHQYKTSERSQYASDGLTLFHDGTHLLEFNIGNVVIERDGHYYTPEHDYILNGCMREFLLDTDVIIPTEIELDTFIQDYKNNRIKLFMINSVREWVPVQLII